MMAYWNQWSHAEIMSIYGIEKDDADLDHDEYDTEMKQEEEGCEYSMESLGLSWRDFM